MGEHLEMSNTQVKGVLEDEIFFWKKIFFFF